MADISKISLPDGTTYNIKDSNALTDDLFNTPIGVTYDSEDDSSFLNSDGLPLVTHNRPILIDFSTEEYDDKQMYYYMHDAYPESTYVGCKFYATIIRLAKTRPDTGEVIEGTTLLIIAINPQNGKIHFVQFKDLSGN